MRFSGNKILFAAFAATLPAGSAQAAIVLGIVDVDGGSPGVRLAAAEMN